MNTKQIERIIRSTVHIVMLNPTTMLPDGIGSGCVINYTEKEILLTVAHVTDLNAGTCIDRGLPPVKNNTPLYSVGAMTYLQKFDMVKYYQQVETLKRIEELKKQNKNPGEKELIDFGLIDFSFAHLKDKADFVQRRLEFSDKFIIKESKKLIIESNLEARPDPDKEYGFFGRIKPLLVEGPTMLLSKWRIYRS